MSGRALWYLTRGSGIVALILLTVAVLAGLLNAGRWARPRWPRFVVEGVHRNLSLLASVFLGVHIASAVIDGYVPIRWADAVIPFGSAYKPVLLGLGALAVDAFVAVAVTSVLRRRLGYRTWRSVHWLAYGCWGLALVHGFLIGSDRHQPWMLAIDLVSVTAVAGAAVWSRVTRTRRPARPAARPGPAPAGPAPPGCSPATRPSDRRLPMIAPSPTRPSTATAPRILRRPYATTLADHRARHGPLPPAGRLDLIGEVEAAGLRGRGGAGFPTAIKLRAVRDGARRARARGAVVLANGTEGEPASAKDTILLRLVPHLVLDGVVAAAAAVGAIRAVVCIDCTDADALTSCRRAIQERRQADPASVEVTIEVAAVPSRYVAGEESALVAWIDGGPAKPTFTPPRPSERGVGGAPTLVDNVETLANVGLIALRGADHWRSVGTRDDPGSTLLTVIGAVERPGVYEVAMGTHLMQVLAQAGGGAHDGLLIGGYFGTWLDPSDTAATALTGRALAGRDASLGCGLVAALPVGHCPLQEVAAVTAWLAANSAGQCGACVHGLPAIAGAVDRLTYEQSTAPAADLDRWLPVVVGRGACKLPDGTARFVDSARRVFARHIDRHLRHGPCPPNPTRVLPTPALGAWR